MIKVCSIMMIDFILRCLLFSFVLSISTSNPIVSATPTPFGQPSEQAPSVPGSNDASLVQNAPTFSPSSPDLHPSLLRRHNQFLSLLNHLSPSPSHAKRSLAVDLLAGGIRLFFDHFDIVVATALEAWRMQEFYQATVREMKARHGTMGELAADRVYIFTITYGALKFSAIQTLNDVGITAEVVAQAVIVFVETMVELSHYILVVPFQSWLLVEYAGRATWVLIRLIVQALDFDFSDAVRNGISG